MQKLFKNKKILYLSSLLIAGIVIVLSLFIFQKNQETATATEWYDESWYYRQQFTIDSTKIDEDLENFPIAVQFNATANPYSNTNSDGSDIRFTDNAGNLLSYEIEKWNESGTSTVHVKIPSISAGADTKFYMYYGNPSAQDAQSPTEVWDENFKAVWHLGEGDSTEAGYYQDSTANNNHGTLTDADGDSATATGKLDGAMDFNGDGDYVEVADNSSLDMTEAVTVSAWIYPQTSQVAEMFMKGNNATVESFEFFQNNNKLYWRLNNNTTNLISTANLTMNTWTHVVATFDRSLGSGNMKIYINGTLDNSSNYTTAMIPNDYSLVIAAYSTGSYPFDGYMDQVTISNISRSAAWVKAEYHLGNNTLISSGAEEQGPGPVGYWSFDEGYGVTANDATVYENDGAITNAEWRDEGDCRVGKCLYFDGSSSYVQIPNSTSLQVDRDATWEAWVRTDADFTRGGLIYKSYDNEFDILLESNGLVSYYHGDGTWEEFSEPPNAKVTLNEWTHIALTRDHDTKTVTWYINGVRVGSDPYADTPLASSNVVSIGKRGSYYFKGFIDEVKIYNYTRTADEIKQSYNQSQSVSFGSNSQFSGSLTDGLVGYWTFDESTANTCSGGVNDACDSSGIGNDGAWNGDASATTTARFGRALGLDGSGDYVNVGTGSDLDITSGNFTLCAWFKSTGTQEDIVANGVSADGRYLLMSYQTKLRGHVWYGGNANTIDSNKVINDGLWHHGCQTVDEENISLYIDGQLDKSQALVGALTSAAGTTIIGSRSATTDAYNFDGAIDEVRLYSRALSSEEIYYLYEWAPGPAMYWNFDEKQGSTLNNSGSYTDSGTIAGTGPLWGIGKYGAGGQFNVGNTGDYAQVSDSTNFDNFPSGSIMAWIKPTQIDSGSGIKHSFFGKNAGGNNNGDVLCGLVQTAQVQCWFDDGAGSSGWNSTAAAQVNQWNHIAITWNKTGLATEFTYYINGKKDTTQTLSSTILPYSVTQVFGIAGSNFYGYMDDIKMYTYARTQKQILEDMMAGKPNNPLVHYSFDDNEGTIAENSGLLAEFSPSTPSDGTLTNMSTSGTSTSWNNNGKKGSALQFSGTDGAYVSVGDESNVRMSSYSISAWIKPQQFSTLSGSDRMTIVSKWNGSSGTQVNYDLAIKSTKKFYVRHSNSTTYSFDSNAVALENEWQHVVVSYDETTNRLALYINGELDKAATATIDPYTGSTAAPRIGAFNFTWADAAYEDEFIGLMDEVKIYNYPLSEDEIRQEYNTGTQTVLSKSENNLSQSSDELLLWYKMDEPSWSGATSQVIDASGSGRHGTPSADATTTSTAKFGRAGEFDGDQDFITVTSLPDTGADHSWTKQFWAKVDGSATTQIFYDSASGNFQSASINGTTGSVAVAHYSGTAFFPWLNYTVPNYTSWNHYAVVYRVDEDLSLYVNGEKVATSPRPLSAFSSPTSGNYDLKYIGEQQTNGAFFNGQMDDFKVYNYARTPEQIMADYTTGPAPVAWWKLDEKTGTSITDVSGGGSIGTLTGSTWETAANCVHGACLQFDGIDDYISMSDPATGLLDVGDENFSISFWFKGRALLAKSLGWPNTGSSAGWVLYTRTNNPYIVFNWGDANDNDQYFGWSTSNLDDGQWHHAVIAVERGGTTYGYIDGVLTNSAANTTTGDISNTANFLIMRSIDSSHVAGYVDDIKLFNYALTQRQVLEEYSGGAPVGFWKFDKGEGETAYDYTKNGLDGTVTIGASGSQATISSAWENGLSGKVNGSLNFDGTDDYVRIPTVSSLQFGSGDFTASVWINPSSASDSRVINTRGRGVGTAGWQLKIHNDGSQWGLYDTVVDDGSNEWFGCASAFCGSKRFSYNEWHHVVMVFDNGTTDVLRYYVDGELVDTDTGGTISSISNSLDTIIGASVYNAGSPDSPAQRYTGKVDEVRLYNYALTPTEVKKEYNSGFVNYFR